MFCEEVRYEDRKRSESWGTERIIAYRLLCTVCSEQSRERARELHDAAGGLMLGRHCDFCTTILTDECVVIELRPCQPATQRRRLGLARVFEQYRMCRHCGAELVARFMDQGRGGGPGAPHRRAS
ncbi:MAG: hypothetical protein IT303_03415 [Dehalococcoidia bacterium]|nr:hypothetical protein [Dehalococcoidia bacterium]